MRLRKLTIRKLAGALGLLLAVSLVLISTPAAAVPQMGHVFYGNVTSDGQPVAQGTPITARVAGLEYTTNVDAQGSYGYTPVFIIPADDPATPGIEGASANDPIDFYIVEVLVDTYPFAIGGYTELNLIVGEAPPSTLAAEAGGPYTGEEGASIALVGSATGGTPTYTYAWDLDNDTVYDDATGASPSQIWATAGTYTIGLQVTDSASDTATDTAEVTVTAAGVDYDTNPKDGVISHDEALAAVNDYLAEPPVITKAQALAVVILYFSY